MPAGRPRRGSTGRRGSSAPRCSGASTRPSSRCARRESSAAILLQFPSYVVYKDASHRLPPLGRRPSSAATGRSSSSATAAGSTTRTATATLALLEELGRGERDRGRAAGRTRRTSSRRSSRATSPLAYVRFHGRNAGHLERARRAAPATASTTSTPRRSWRSGSSRCASWGRRTTRSTSSSTTTAGAARPGARSSPRRPGMQRLFGKYWTDQGFQQGKE